MTNQAASLPVAAVRPKARACGSCRGPLDTDETVCRRCGADNAGWLKFQTSHFNAFRLREVLALAAGLGGLLLMLALGWALFVVLGAQVWGEGVGVVLLLASIPPAAVGFVYAWSEREAFRQAQHMPGVNLKTEYERFTRLSLVVVGLSLAAAVGGPLLVFIAPLVLQSANALFGLSFSTQLPEITRGTYVLMFLAVWFFYAMHVLGRGLGGTVAREYALAADAVAPPFIFERQENFHELCKQAVLLELAASVDQRKVRWHKLERTGDGGMTVEIGVPHGDRVVEKINEFDYERVPLERKYTVKLDRWARLTSIALMAD